MNAHSVTSYTKTDFERKEKSNRPSVIRYQRKMALKLISGPSIFFNGGEDRTRTCKRLRAVVFKTTALPIRLPLRTVAKRGSEQKIYRNS